MRLKVAARQRDLAWNEGNKNRTSANLVTKQLGSYLQEGIDEKRFGRKIPKLEIKKEACKALKRTLRLRLHINELGPRTSVIDKGQVLMVSLRQRRPCGAILIACSKQSTQQHTRN